MYENNNSTGNYSGGQKVNTDTYQQNYDYGSSYNSSYGSSYSGNYNSGYSNSYNNYRREPQKQKTSLAVKALTFALCGTLFGTFAGAGFYGINLVNKYILGKSNITVEVPSENALEETPLEKPVVQLPGMSQTQVITTDVTEVVEKVMPAMVSIVNKYVEKSTFFGQTFSQEAQSSGSGIIIAQDEKELLIATNYHVIDGAETLEVTFLDGKVAKAQVKGRDSGMDLAVIAISLESIDADTKQAITVAKLGDSDALKLGEQVIAIGNALGYGQSVTGGWVSALNREVKMGDGSKGTFIQTDAAINGGNSGGALLNMNGEVVGINSSKISGYGVEGMGYAIPIAAAEPIISDLMTKETREKVEDGNVGYMGVSLQAVTSEMSTYFNIPTGIYVMEVEKGSAAEAAGTLPYDVITNSDGEKIVDYEDLQAAMQYYAPGDTADTIVMRQGNGEYTAVELEITLGKRPEN